MPKLRFTTANKLHLLSSLQASDALAPRPLIEFLNAVSCRSLDVSTARTMLEDMAAEAPPLVSLSGGSVFLLPAGRCWLSNHADAVAHRRAEFVRWLVTTVLSCIAIAVSIVALLLG